MVQEFEQITTKKQNELARLYPFWFDQIPEDTPAPLLFGSSNYDLHEEVSLQELIELKGQSVEAVHYGKGVEYQKQTVLSSYYVQKRRDKIRARKNYEQRLSAGAVRPGALGIVGSNLDICNTSKLEKEVRAGLFRAQNMIQKVRLGVNLSDFDIEVVECAEFSPVPYRFEPIPLKRPIVSDTVCSCGKPLGHVVELQRHKEHGSGSINGVATCKSVWACPVCRTRIIQERSEELKQLYDKWRDQGGHVFMLTLTVPHKKGDNLAELYGSNAQGTGISGAMAKFRSSRDFGRLFKEKSGYLGDVRGVEVTWGKQNGFHPHVHMLIFSKYTFDFKEFRHRFYKTWSRACVESGLKRPSWEHGVDVSYCEDPEQAQYIAKWSAATELVSDGMKKARAGNFSIAELERCLYDRKYRESRRIGLKRTAAVLRAYYGAMHGQRMLQTGGISPDGNWKKELLEITDEDDSDRENHAHICDLEYRTYIKIKRAGKLPDLLQAAERGTSDAHRIANVRKFLTANDYDPEAARARGPGPPPSCFSYSTDVEDDFYRDKMLQANPDWQ